MDNIYSKLKELAKSVKAQNLFVAAKDLQGIHIFRNVTNLSRIQGLYLLYLYNYDGIYKDIILEKISEHITDCELYEDAYLLWKRKNFKKIDKPNNKPKDLKLSPGRNIKFPGKKVK